jgi:Family of unknown function (DUF5994)
MTTTSTPLPIPDPSAAPAVRVSLKPACEHPGTVQGAWWPRSRDLAAELPPLIAVLDRSWSEINRATVNVTMWPDVPHVLRAGGHNVHIGWFDAEQEADDLCVLTYLAGRWDLLVVPPETDPDRAARLMAAASDVDNHQTSRDLMSDAASAASS